jgi:hypothetical protein
MRFLSKTKDGGPQSPVDAYFLFEIKSVISIALLKFNKGGREAFHTHAFTALTWFLCGDIKEQCISGEVYTYKRSLLPKVTKREKNHRVYAAKTSWCLTIRGPWTQTWTETQNNKTITLTHNRRIINIE